MSESKPNIISFHNAAAERFNALAQELLGRVGSFGKIAPRTPPPQSQIHPTFVFGSEHIIGEIKTQDHSINGLGEETGRFWNSNGIRVGWQGAEFEDIQKLVRRFEGTSEIKGRVSYKFLLDETFNWMQQTLERKRHDSLTDYIAECCSRGIREYEIWIPVYRTFSSKEFSIGDVVFRTVSKTLFDQFYSNVPKEKMEEPDVALAINRQRSAIQGGIAACIKVSAEYNKAHEIAHAAATEAIGLLRFLSFVNWTSKLVSHCLPLGRENTKGTTELLIESGTIKSIHKGTLERGPSGWNIDEARASLTPIVPSGVLNLVDQLATHRDSTEFKHALYDAMILYSRASIEAEVSNKFVFVLAALESLLLKDGSEPIQGNLGERMAFLIATTVVERRDVVRNVKEFYSIRSAFIHHGQPATSEQREIVDKFLFSAWLCFVRLLTRMDQYASRAQLFDELEELKLS